MSELNAPTKRSKLLPENAYRKLSPGEEYRPIVAPGDLRPEVTGWAVTVGLVLTAIFAAACIYIALRAGNGIEASIPIAILAIFFGKLKGTRSSILENVIVQSIGQASGVVAAGAAFLVPAIYINDLHPTFWQIFLACFIGGSLGVVLIIPLRKYFVKDLHGDLPFPEATAVNEILCSGESSGPTAGKLLIIAFLLGAGFDFMIEGFHLWPGMISSTAVFGDLGRTMAANGFEIKIFGIAALFGLGYIIGLKYASIIASGSVLAVLVMVPLVFLFGSQAGEFQMAGATYDIAKLGAGGVFNTFIKPIGIGAIAISGLIGIIRMGRIVGSSVSLGFKGFKKGTQATDDPRTQLDMNPKNVLLVQFGMVLLLALLFFVVAMTTTDSATGQTYTLNDSLLYAVVGAVVGFLLSFLFTPVAAQAIAIVGVNPVSGMTLITVVLTIVVLVAFGLKGEGGMFVALVVGTAVCTALSTSGALISDFKIGYWIGATPRQQQRWKFLGLAVAALVVALVIPVMDASYGFVVRDPSTGEPVRDEAGNLISNAEELPAPQANMIAAVSRGLLSDPAKQPWLLYGLGAIIAIVLYMAGTPMLAFALGMYLPIGINMAVLAGAFTAWIISKTGGSERVRQARTEQGTLIASGMMAGAAIFGILTAVMRIPDLGGLIRYIGVGVNFELKELPSGATVLAELPVEEGTFAHFYEEHGQLLALVMLIGLAIAAYFLARWGARGTLREEDAAPADKPAE
jgi:putative OPT family oligopeptide transporter